MGAYYLDIIIDTAEHVPIQFRIALDETTRNKLLQLHPVATRLIHTLDPNKFTGVDLPGKVKDGFIPAAPPVDPLDKFKICDG